MNLFKMDVYSIIIDRHALPSLINPVKLPVFNFPLMEPLSQICHPLRRASKSYHGIHLAQFTC